MTQIAIAAAGAAIGFVVSGFNPVGAQIGWMAGSIVGGMVTPGPKTEGPRLQDLAVSSSAYGSPRPWVFGTARVPGQIIWSSGLKETRNTRRRSGKGGSGRRETTYTYSASFALALCRGPVSSILRIWADSKLIYDGSATKDWLKLRFYPGDETQGADPLIQQALGASRTPAYRGTAYIVFEDFRLEDFGNRIPNITCEVSVDTISDTPSSHFADNPPLPFLSGFDNYEYVAGVDFTRRRIFVENFYAFIDETDRDAFAEGFGWYILNMDTMKVTKRMTLLDLFKTLDNPLLPTGPATGISTYRATLVLDRNTGTILLNFGNRSYVVDPDTFQIRNYYTGPSAGTINQIQVITNPSSGTREVVGVTTTVVSGVVPTFQAVVIRTTDTVTPTGTMIEVTGTAAGLYIEGETTYQPVIAGANFGNVCEFWWMSYPRSATDRFLFYKLTVEAGATSTLGTSLSLVGSVPFSSVGVPPNDPALLPLFRPINSAEYDPIDGAIIVAAWVNPETADPSAHLFKWGEGEGVKWTAPYCGFAFADWNNQSPTLKYPTQGRLGVRLYKKDTIDQPFFDVGIAVFDTVTGKLTRFSDVFYENYPYVEGELGRKSADLKVTPAYWDSQSNSIIGMVDPWKLSTTFSGYFFPIDRAGRIFLSPTGVGIPLSSIVEDICEQAGLTPSIQVDASDLDQVVRGYVVSRPSSAKAALEPLLSAFFVQVVESDGKLKFTKRGSPSAVTIDQRWLGRLSDGTDGDSYWKHTRRPELELPRSVRVRYSDPDSDYQVAVQTDQRVMLPLPTMWSRQDVDIELPIALSADEAKEVARRLLYNTWVARDEYNSVLPWRFSYLDPGDTITVNLDNGTQYVVRLVKATIGADYSMEVSTVAEDSVIYGLEASGGASEGFPQQTIPTLRSARLFILDLPLLRDVDEPAGSSAMVYYGASAYDDTWNGSILLTSPDNSTYSEFDVLTASLDWGVCVDPLPSTTLPWATDTTGEVRVFLGNPNATLSSVTRLDMLNGANVALLGKEIIQFQTAILNDDGSYTLRDLLRGRRGTEWAVGTHVPGEDFLLLSTSTVAGRLLPASDLNVNTYFKLVTIGAFEADTIPQVSSFKATSMLPYSPVHHKRAAAGGDLTLTWVRRTRVGGSWVDFVDASLGETSERYEVYVLSAAYDPAVFDPTNPSTYVRNATGLTSPSWTYTAAQMATDGFTPASDTLHVVVYQVSEEFGRGLPGPASLTP